MKSKNAEVGVATLVIFIAGLLVAAIAAGVLIQTAGNLQEKSLSTGSQAKGQVATSARVTEVSATDGTNSTLNYFSYIVKLSPGSSPIKLSQAILSVSTTAKSATLRYRGPNSIGEKNNSIGYNTFREQEFGQIPVYDEGYYRSGSWGITFAAYTTIGIDLDGDGINDTAMACHPDGSNCGPTMPGTHIRFNLSSAGIINVRLLNEDGTQAYLKSGTAGNFSFNNLKIGNYGYMTGSRSQASQDGRIIPEFDTVFGIYRNREILDDDLDDDGKDDYFAINASHAIFFLSSAGEIATPLNEWLSGGNNLDVDAQIENASETFGTLQINGTTTLPAQIDEDVTVKVTPEKEGSGYFSAEYLQTGTNHINGNIQRGDVVDIFFEAPEDIHENSPIRINFIPKIGTSTLTEFITPEVISEERIYLYP